MNINKIDLEYVTASGFSSLAIDGVRHVKVLPYLSVVQAVEGTYDIGLGDKLYNTDVGGFFIAPSGIQQTIIHNADPLSRRMTCRWLFLKVRINDMYYVDDLYDFPTVLPSSLKEEMNSIFNRLFGTNSTVDQYVCYYQIVKLLLSVGIEKERVLPSYMVRALTYIKHHYTEKISVQDLANHVNLSVPHFFNVFKKQMGISPIAYINSYRLSLAAEWLLATDITISEIAHSIGISDAMYFNKLFKKAYQMSPTEYRKNYNSKAR